MGAQTIDYDSLARQNNGAEAVDYDALANSNHEVNSPSAAADYQSQTRMMALSGLTGMPTPNMNDQDRQSYGRGKATGYVSGIAAGALGGALASPAADAGIYETAKAYGYASEMVKDALTSQTGRYILQQALKHGITGAGFGAVYGLMKKAGLFSK